MLIRLIAIGNKMPPWIIAGFRDYAKRLPFFQLLEIPAEKRTKTVGIEQLIKREGEKILSVIPPGNRVIALEVKGSAWSTEQLSLKLKTWQIDGRNIDLLIGGPDGLASACLQRAEEKWSLSALTLPHPIARIVVVEQMYRAYSILQNHPYHRA